MQVGERKTKSILKSLMLSGEKITLKNEPLVLKSGKKKIKNDVMKTRLNGEN